MHIYRLVPTSDVTSAFAYNPAGQLASRSRSNDGYAFAGYVGVNRAYAVNGLNQYTSAGPATFTYDANGNLTGDGTTTYEYDIENRLVSTNGGAGAILTYDPLGRLFSFSGPGEAKTRLLYDGDQLAAEYYNGAIARRYVHGLGEDDPLLWYEGANLSDRRTLKADHQGSIVAVSTGLGVQPYAYDDYGIPNPAQTGRFQYTGQAWIAPLGMYYYKARIYSPTLGRFLQTDPIGYDDQINLYAYVGNDPVNKTDPTGTRCTGEGDQLVCSIDQIETSGKPLTAAQTADIKAYNADYTASVKTLSSNPDQTVQVSHDGKTFGAKAGDVVQTLRDRVMIAAPNGFKGQQVTGTTADGTTTILGGAALAGKMDTISSASDDRRVTTVHEGIHRGPGENSVRPPFSNRQLNGAAHSLKWDNAARRLLGLPEIP